MAGLTGSDWRAETGDLLRVYRYPSARRLVTPYEHHFTPQGIEDEAAAADLRVVHHERASRGLLVLAG